ncbi:LysR family transcriptional regulator [Granulosicoccus antarcticus]|uniref:PCP degradation transcriptional activation protein n=1 Tax=Granulosicoccus antarcticus IMCC3135 TaxID=1192854 RepID=A0A2Z2NHD1_9GAMM|nr:LysR family transcriptional regulator [Granulosicoccus antarcticus]ASJ70716.1 PCP degradation transcriptional activation protein [Granulosicoccus antarcticus IMCC3135]
MSKIDRLEIRQLRILQALLREKNVSRVAQQVGLTQQAVSDQLRKLRDIFDDRLFLRKSNGLIPTPMAEQLGEKIEAILHDFEQLLTPDSFEPHLIDSTYVIAATDYAQQVVLPDLLSKIRQQAPRLKIIIQDLDIDTLNDAMVAGRVNLVVAFPDFVPSNYPCITLFTEHHVCVASKTSSVVGKKLSLEAIARHPQIIASPSRPNFRGSIDSWFEQFGLERNVVISAPCFSIVPLYLETTDAIAFLPSRALIDSKLATIELKESPVSFEVITAWHPRSNQDPLHNWVVDFLRAD